MSQPNERRMTRQVTMSEFNWGQLQLLVRDALREQEHEAECARKAPDRKVAAARADDLRDMMVAITNSEVIDQR